MKSVLALGAVAATASASASTESLNPITRIAELLQGLAKKVEEDGKAEGKLFMKYKCWYKSTLEEKKASNADARARISELETFIDDVENGRVDFTSDRGDREKELAAIIATLEKAKDVREQENADFLAAKDEMTKAITALDSAIGTLDKATKGSFLARKAHMKHSQAHPDMASLLAERLEAKQAVQLASTQLNSADLHFLQRALEVQPAGGKDWETLNKGQKYAKKYTKRSGEIQNILKEMKETFDENLADAEAKELAASNSYDALKSAKESEKTAAEKALNELKGESAARASNKNDAETEKTALETQVTNDVGFIDEIEKAYKAKLALYKDRKTVRVDEVAAISEAIGFLRSDDARDTMKKSFASQGYFFVQTASKSESAKMERALSSVASGYKKAGVTQRQLAKVMAKMQKKAGEDSESIKAVIDAIDTMVTDLKVERQADLDKDDKCKKDTKKNMDEAAEQARTVDTKLATIARKEARIADFKDKTEKAEAVVEELKAAAKEASQTRADENTEYKTNKADDTAAASLIQSAMDALKKFYKERDFMQVSGSASVAAPGEAPAPPPPTFEGAYEGEQESGKGVVGIMEMIAADVQKDIDEATAEEQASEQAYSAFVEANSADRLTQETLIEEYTKKISKAEIDKVDAHTDKTDAKGLLEAEIEMLKSYKTGCDFMAVNIGLRNENRQLEMDGLDKAKTILTGGSA